MKEEWRKYYELEPIRRLKNEGRELLGNLVYITEKRDGENVSLTLKPIIENHIIGTDVLPQCVGFIPAIHSHNQEIADDNIQNRFRQTSEYPKAIQLLKDETNYQKHYILYGELIPLTGPTRIEHRKKHITWVLFDIFSITENRYLSYNEVYQKAYHYHIPIVNLLEVTQPVNLEELKEIVDKWLKWCKKHRREGIVGKCYNNQVFFKEKIDLPKITKFPKNRQVRIEYPPMPNDKIIRALQHAYDECIKNKLDWKLPKDAMPLVAKHLENEAKEHLYTTPHNMYRVWLDNLNNKEVIGK